MQPLVTVVIPTMNRKEALLRLLGSVRDCDYPRDRIEVIVVDNASADGTAGAVREAFPDVTLLRQDRNVFCGGARAVGEAASHGDFVFYVDDDNVLDAKCISELVRMMASDPSVGIAAPLMTTLRKPDEIWCAGGTVDWWGRVSYLHAGEHVGSARSAGVIEATFFPNAYMTRGDLARRDVQHDAVAFPHNWNEPDFACRVRRQGKRAVTVTSALTVHDIDYAGPLTRIGIDKTYDQARSRVRYRRRYLRSFPQWLAFFLIVLPASTTAYVKAFAAQKEHPFVALFGAYLRGTVDGFRGSV